MHMCVVVFVAKWNIWTAGEMSKNKPKKKAQQESKSKKKVQWNADTKKPLICTQDETACAYVHRYVHTLSGYISVPCKRNDQFIFR